MNLVFATGYLVPQRVLGQDYFRDARAAFPGACFPRVPGVGSIEVRARALAAAIAGFAFPDPRAPAHLVAHSMGGLDARYALHHDVGGLSTRVASLSTIATPHHGSPVADLLVGGAAGRWTLRGALYGAVARAVALLGVPTGGLRDLTTSRARRFNDAHPDIGGIPCYCYAGARADAYLLRATSAYIRAVGRAPEDRDNDGLVSVASAAWRSLAETPWPTDHLGEVGHTLAPPRFASSFPHLDALRRVVAHAASR